VTSDVGMSYCVLGSLGKVILTQCLEMRTTVVGVNDETGVLLRPWSREQSALGTSKWVPYCTYSHCRCWEWWPKIRDETELRRRITPRVLTGGSKFLGCLKPPIILANIGHINT